MSELLTPFESSEHIVQHAKYIKILPDGIANLKHAVIAGINNNTIDVDNFSQHEFHPKPTDAHAVEWIFVIDTLNFCFWTPTNYTKYKVNSQTGYFALCAAINRAMSDGLDITNASYYSNIDENTLRHIFRSDDGETMVPLLEERLKCLHEVGTRLLEKWQGKFVNMVHAANHSAKKLLQLIVQEFPCFRDEAVYAGKRVALYKRAQILIGDLWACYRGVDVGKFTDIDYITMFADYRIPQVLVHFRSLEYTPELLEVLRRDELLPNGDPMEVEIRGASIFIVEEVKEFVRQILREQNAKFPVSRINSILIDHFLWDYRRTHAAELEHIPFHKTQSVYY